jgi:triosephosphate isomerase
VSGQALAGTTANAGATATSRRPLFGANWKMNLTSSEARDHLVRLRALLADISDRDVFVLPAYTSLWVAREELTGSPIAWGAQDVHPEDGGAHTGDVSAPMLADLGCRYVEIGHSERVREHGETRDLVARKVVAVVRSGLTPVLCVGETEPLDEAAAIVETLVGVERSLAALIDRPGGASLVIAYEPAWTIGVGARPAPPKRIGRVHRAIKEWLERHEPAPSRVIYGGSVDPSVASAILAEPGVDGLFVGRMSLDAEAFARIALAPVPRPKLDR